MIKRIINIVITLILGAILYYFTLPAINLNNIGFYFFIGFLIIIFTLLESIERNKTVLFRKGKLINANSLSEPLIYGFGAVFGVFIIIMVVNFICSPIFNAKSYQTRISVNENGNFTEDIHEVDFSQLPLLDKASSQVLGDRVMGQMSELVSQYKVSDLYTQINYNNSILRVTPLEYADEIKWFTNRKNGIVGYITVDSVTGESNLVRLEKGMKYSTSAMFNEKLERKLRFDYPTTNFGRISFEIDNEGKPYYIIPTIKYTAVGLKAKVTGVIDRKSTRLNSSHRG